MIILNTSLYHKQLDPTTDPLNGTLPMLVRREHANFPQQRGKERLETRHLTSILMVRKSYNLRSQGSCGYGDTRKDLYSFLPVSCATSKSQRDQRLAALSLGHLRFCLPSGDQPHILVEVAGSDRPEAGYL
jgi:hypothetical protein